MPIPTSQCWPNDQDYLDGATELHVPSSAVLKAYWDADLIDQYGVDPGTIIAVTDPFVVRFRVELVGDLWRCLRGDWCFDMLFGAIGDGPSFNLSDKLPAGTLDKKGWEGCQEVCIEVKYTVAPGTIPAEHCGTLYEVGATFALRCCNRDRPILVGFEALEERQFF